MQKKFLITIHVLQSSYDYTESSDIELLTEGDFYKEDGVYFCDYAESEITGLDGTDTSIEIGSNYVSLQRSGNVNSQMLFMAGRKTSSLYSLPYGELTVDIYTEKLKTNVDEHGGSISIDYIIDINNATTGRNNFEIAIREEM